jgi:predicted N-acetyltransferase YhbS
MQDGYAYLAVEIDWKGSKIAKALARLWERERVRFSG